MTRAKQTTKTTETMTCTCQEHKGKNPLALTNFYNSNSPMAVNGKAPFCKQCIKNMIDYNNIDTIYRVLTVMDIPFIYDYWEKSELASKDTFGNYIRMANSLMQFKGLTWKDSIFANTDNKSNNEKIKNIDELISNDERLRLIDKWGLGYSDEELYSFEKKYDLLKENYPQKTAMHTEALLTYIRYRVKEELSTAEGNVSDAQKWGQLADKASERAKINPSQLSKADLSGGLNGFSELSRAVEQVVDVISILPKFKEKPQDKVDFTLLCYINYVRRLKNLPDVEYKDIWQFYEERKEEYKQNDDDREFKFEDEK